MISLYIRDDGFCVFEKLINPSKADLKKWEVRFIDENKHNKYGPAVRRIDGPVDWYLSGVKYDSYLEYILERELTHNCTTT